MRVRCVCLFGAWVVDHSERTASRWALNRKKKNEELIKYELLCGGVIGFKNNRTCGTLAPPA